jgi:hypothetical protein
MVNHYYIYAVDRDFGPFFLKFYRYFPFNAKLCLNGHEYAKRQLARQGIAFEALDNGMLSCANPDRLQNILRRRQAYHTVAIRHVDIVLTFARQRPRLRPGSGSLPGLRGRRLSQSPR